MHTLKRSSGHKAQIFYITVQAALKPFLHHLDKTSEEVNFLMLHLCRSPFLLQSWLMLAQQRAVMLP